MEEMKKEELLKILKDGVKAWNHWISRSEYYKKFMVDLSETNLSGMSLIKINLRHADLNGANLSGANLSEANLSGAYLDGANLNKANLKKANLSRANLSEATLINTLRLSKAILDGANLNDADLTGVNLNGTSLIETDLSEADLSEADLSEANLSGANLEEANLSGANLSKAQLSGANLIETDLSGANLSEANLLATDLNAAKLVGANLNKANLNGANLSEANLSQAFLIGANLSKANLSAADLSEADLSGAVVIQSNLKNAKLTSCRIYGISAWDVEFDKNTEQQDLIITPHNQSTITVDNLEVAQFIYLLLKNEKIRQIIDEITSKVVLILGRFTKERKIILDALREELRRMNLMPILFDFDKPDSKDLTGTVETLARMARFIIADLTDPSSIPHELATIVPFLRTTPVLPLKLIGSCGYSMSNDLNAYSWVLKTHEYKDGTSLLSVLPEVIAPADKMAEELRKIK
jgi:uncharacterized protein YjbI with pentapeptide repeats